MVVVAVDSILSVVTSLVLIVQFHRRLASTIRRSGSVPLAPVVISLTSIVLAGGVFAATNTATGTNRSATGRPITALSALSALSAVATVASATRRGTTARSISARVEAP